MSLCSSQPRSSFTEKRVSFHNLFLMRFGFFRAHLYTPCLRLAENCSSLNYSAAFGAPAEACGGRGEESSVRMKMLSLKSSVRLWSFFCLNKMCRMMPCEYSRSYLLVLQWGNYYIPTSLYPF